MRRYALHAQSLRHTVSFPRRFRNPRPPQGDQIASKRPLRETVCLLAWWKSLARSADYGPQPFRDPVVDIGESMRDFRTLTVWKKAHRVTLEVYRLTRAFPREERFGLTAHLRKSAASVPTNLAEGCGRAGERELARFVSIASGSASETEYQLLLACDLGYLSTDEYRAVDGQVNEVKKMLGALHRKLTADS